MSVPTLVGTPSGVIVMKSLIGAIGVLFYIHIIMNIESISSHKFLFYVLLFLAGSFSAYVCSNKPSEDILQHIGFFKYHFKILIYTLIFSILVCLCYQDIKLSYLSCITCYVLGIVLFFGSDELTYDQYLNLNERET